MAIERLYIENTYIPLSQGLNPSIEKAITDLSNPEKRKATYTKTIKIPRSKEADKIFSQMFEVNIINRTFNVQARADVLYTVDGNTIIRGYCQLKELSVNDFNDIFYDIVAYSDTANFWVEIQDGYLTDLYTTTASFEGLDKYDHAFTWEIQAYSWATQVWYDGGFIPFDYGTGYVYPLIDYGFSTDATNFDYDQIGCAIYVREYLRKIISWAGFEYDSSWIDGSVCEHLIIPSSPATYNLTTAQIEDMEFVANTPEFLSNGTTTTANLTKNAYGANDQLIFTNDSVAPAQDPGLNYDPVTGVFTAVTSGFYDINVLVDLTVEFKPDTANAVKTRCEVDGWIVMGHTPNGTSTETQVNAVAYYITYDDSSAFVSGTRTTTSSPTYPDTDYLRSKAWSVSLNEALIARTASVPNRYHLAANNVFLLAGDELRIYHKSGVFAKTNLTNVYTTDFFVDTFGTYYTGNAKLKCSVGAFYNKVANTTLSQGNTLTMSRVIPDKVRMMDFFTSILKMFNLWVDVDPLNPYKIIVEQRDTYLGSTTLNIHELIDRSRDITHIPMGALDVRRFNFNYKEDKDYYNQKYQAAYSGVYGNREIDTVNEFFTQEKDTTVIFSPTPLVGLPNQDRVLPTIYQLTDANLPIPTQHNIRILYYGGLKNCSQTWNHIHYLQGWPYLPLVDTYSTYPYAGHFDDPYNATLDINFGLVKEVYYDDNLQTITVTNANLVNVYHSNYLCEITDEDSRIVHAYVHLTPAKYLDFTFDKLYYFDNAYFRLQRISGYNPTSEETTLCEFLKLTSIPAVVSIPVIGTGGVDPVSPTGGGGGVIFEEARPAKGTQTKGQQDSNNIVPKSASVMGTGNVVWTGASQVKINGYGNIVETEAKNINIQGDNNTITAGVENVTLINTSGITVTESNVTYVNGILVNNIVEYIDTDTTASKYVRSYYVDASSGTVDLTFNITTTDFEEGQLFFIKAIDITNTNRVRISGGTVDGAADYTFSEVNEAIEIQFYMDNFYIVSNKNTGGGGGSGLTHGEVMGRVDLGF